MNCLRSNICLYICVLFFYINGCTAQEEANASNDTLLIRLREGKTENEGRVEIYHRGEWGTICDDDWNIEAANVVCRMLGYDGAWEYLHSGKFGPGEGDILMDNVQCTGDESVISSCQFNGWKNHDCSHHEDAGVKCNKRRLPGFHRNLQTGDEGLDFIRLKPPRGHRKRLPQLDGYVEFYHQKKWRKVCSTGWDLNTASVICGQLGFPRAEEITDRSHYLARARKKHYYWLSNITCIGTENKVSQCKFQNVDTSAYNTCPGEPLITRCIPGPKYARGNFKKGGKRRKHRKHNVLSQKTIRLKVGSAEGEGRLEVMRSGRWGTVCHRGWNLWAANVACRELGFGTAKREIINSYFGAGHGPIWLTDLNCRGNETQLSDCQHGYISTSAEGYEDSELTECNHEHDAGVACYVPQFNANQRIRLVGGRNPMEGRVEVKIRKRWGAVCSNDWTIKEAMVVCRQLGLGFALHSLKDVYFFPGSENITEIVMTGIHCKGDELALQFCPSDGRRLSVCGDPHRSSTPFAGVICTELSPDLMQDIPLLQQSLHLEDRPLHNLYCASEEGCLSPSAEKMEWPYGSRRLLRFSTRVWNRGRADFRPARSQDQWIWHQCHGHYHSMAEFTHYDILDLNFTKVAEGHKASFCLEDSECSPGVSPRFDCDQPGGGVQGIAVGCADNYQYNIDCQWIDISDITAGNYLIRIRVNPGTLVAESDFGNNEVICNLQYDGSRVWAWNCHIPDDFDPEILLRYYTSEVYP
ncbi:lysyl oxidase homolog 3A [Ciona intestinalis]